MAFPLKNPTPDPEDAALDAAPSDSPEELALDWVGLEACIEDVVGAFRSAEPDPPYPDDFAGLCRDLKVLGGRLPPAYEEAMLRPCLAVLESLGAGGFERLLQRDPKREGLSLVLLDVAQALLQRDHSRRAIATEAFQEVVVDLHDGFLGAAGRRGPRGTGRPRLPPLVKWGRREYGPYTFPGSVTRDLGCAAGVVSLPAPHADAGLLGWAALGHETAGHEILRAEPGLVAELARAVRRGLGGGRNFLARYWSGRIDEAAADVLGILNLGPAAAVGMVGYARALNRMEGGYARLRNRGASRDPHPADILRGYLSAETVALLAFDGRSAWAEALACQVTSDQDVLRLEGGEVDRAEARESARHVAEILVRHPCRAWEGRALGDVQDWRERDQAIVRELRGGLRAAGASSKPPGLPEGAGAAHVVAAAVEEALAAAAPGRVQGAMVGLLSRIHRSNLTWGR